MEDARRDKGVVGSSSLTIHYCVSLVYNQGGGRLLMPFPCFGGAALKALKLLLATLLLFGCSSEPEPARDEPEPLAAVVTPEAIQTEAPTAGRPTAVSRKDALLAERPTETPVPRLGEPTALPPMPPPVSLQPGTQTQGEVPGSNETSPSIPAIDEVTPVSSSPAMESPTPVGFFLQAPTRTPTPVPTATAIPSPTPTREPTPTATPAALTWEEVHRRAEEAEKTDPISYDHPGMAELSDGSRMISFDALGDEAPEFDIFVNLEPLDEENNIKRVYVRGPYVVVEMYKNVRLVPDEYGRVGWRDIIVSDQAHKYTRPEGNAELILNGNICLGYLCHADEIVPVWADTGERVELVTGIGDDRGIGRKLVSENFPDGLHRRFRPRSAPVAVDLKLEAATMNLVYNNAFFRVIGFDDTVHYVSTVRAGDCEMGLERSFQDGGPPVPSGTRLFFAMGLPECLGLGAESMDVYPGLVQLRFDAVGMAGTLFDTDIFEIKPEQFFYSYDIDFLTYGFLGEEVLRAVNLARAERGISPLELGDRLLSQEHAQNSLLGCYTSHWDKNGLKPYMRYALDGGYQTNAELWVGTTANYNCRHIKNYRYYTSESARIINTLERIRFLLEHSVDQLAESPVHGPVLFSPHFAKINYGFAFDEANWRLVLHLETDMLEETGAAIATMNASGLKLEAEFTEEAYARGYRFAWAELLEDSPRPYGDLDTLHLNRTHCYKEGDELGGTIGIFYDSRSTELANRDYDYYIFACNDPYKWEKGWPVDPWEDYPEDMLTNDHDGDRYRGWLTATMTDRKPPVYSYKNYVNDSLYPASVWENGRKFGLDATLPSRLCLDEGCSDIMPGIYSLIVYALKPGEEEGVAVGHQVIWVGVDPKTGMEK